MNWIFWVLLVLTMVIMLTPFTGVLTPEVSFIFWAVGSLLAVAALIWIVTTFSQINARQTESIRPS